MSFHDFSRLLNQYLQQIKIADDIAVVNTIESLAIADLSSSGYQEFINQITYHSETRRREIITTFGYVDPDDIKSDPNDIKSDPNDIKSDDLFNEYTAMIIASNDAIQLTKYDDEIQLLFDGDYLISLTESLRVRYDELTGNRAGDRAGTHVGEVKSQYHNITSILDDPRLVQANDLEDQASKIDDPIEKIKILSQATYLRDECKHDHFAYDVDFDYDQKYFICDECHRFQAQYPNYVQSAPDQFEDGSRIEGNSMVIHPNGVVEYSKCFIIAIWKLHFQYWINRGLVSPSALLAEFKRHGGHIDIGARFEDITITKFAEIFQIEVVVVSVGIPNPRCQHIKYGRDKLHVIWNIKTAHYPNKTGDSY
jgi:hypothetical protein